MSATSRACRTRGILSTTRQTDKRAELPDTRDILVTVSARILLGCSEETASVEFRLYATEQFIGLWSSNTRIETYAAAYRIYVRIKNGTDIQTDGETPNRCFTLHSDEVCTKKQTKAKTTDPGFLLVRPCQVNYRADGRGRYTVTTFSIVFRRRAAFVIKLPNTR